MLEVFESGVDLGPALRDVDSLTFAEREVAVPALQQPGSRGGMAVEEMTVKTHGPRAAGGEERGLEVVGHGSSGLAPALQLRHRVLRIAEINVRPAGSAIRAIEPVPDLVQAH